MLSTRAISAIQDRTISNVNILTKVLWVVAFAALTAIGARIEIPHEPVPYTLQTLFALLSGAFLGRKYGALSQLLYLSLGIMGLPVFAASVTVPQGVARLLGPTGGYLLGCVVAAFVVGWLVHLRWGFAWMILSMAAGLFIMFFVGTIQLNLVLVHDWPKAFASGFLVFSWWDGLKLLAAATIYHQVAKRYPSL
jgi:biotin transport system substrate-specific component